MQKNCTHIAKQIAQNAENFQSKNKKSVASEVFYNGRMKSLNQNAAFSLQKFLYSHVITYTQSYFTNWFLQEKMGFKDASEFCQTNSMQLFTNENQNLYDAILENVKSSDYDRRLLVWIGAKLNSSKWQWLTGEKYENPRIPFKLNYFVISMLDYKQ